MYERREVFPQTPLALVAAEVSFTDAPRLRKAEVLDDFAIAMEERLPVVEQTEESTFNFGPNLPLQMGGQVQGLRLMSRDKTSVLTVFPSRLTYETTRYTEFPAFRDEFLNCVSALTQLKVRPAVRRVGLRYIDEIRIPGVGVDARSWAPWVDRRLVDHLSIGPKSAIAQRNEGLMIFNLGGGRGLNIRFAALPAGVVVTAPNPVREVADKDQPFFVLDFDGYQEFDSYSATLLDADTIKDALDAVHPYAGEAFQESIGDKSRALFRGETP